MTPEEINAALTAPFQVGEVKFKPQSVKGNRALAMAYIDCRVVQDRLDDVLGVENWADDYEIVSDGSVVCRLRLKIGGEWITKTDVGSPSEQPDSGDRLKAAFSDALKRAAVKFGIGRYLYRLPAVWCDYDPQKRQFSGTPQLPAWAIPKGQPQAKQTQPKQPASTSKLPATGEELHKRLREYDAKLAGEKKCGLGATLSHVANAGVKAGFGDDITRWSGPAIQFAVDAIKAFEAGLTRPQHEPAQQEQPAKPKQEPPKSVRELWERISGSPAPQTGDELVKWVKSLDASLGRLTPDHNAGELIAAVAQFLRVDVDKLGTLKGKELESGWNNAKQYVKACETPAPTGK